MADILPEKWMKGVAVTTTILAVMTAIVSARTSSCVSRIQILTALEGSNWSYFQAKSIKQNFADAQKRSFALESLGAVNLAQKNAYDVELSKLEAESIRYGQEKDGIKKEAIENGQQNHHIQQQNNQFSISIVFYQIAIMLSSVSALVKRKELWIFGIVFGVVATLFFVNGFFLIYKLPFVF